MRRIKTYQGGAPVCSLLWPGFVVCEDRIVGKIAFSRKFLCLRGCGPAECRNAKSGNRRRPSAGNGTHVRATRRYTIHIVHRGGAAHTRALPSTLARRTRASAVLASGGYRSCGLERLQRVDSDTLAGTHKDSLHTRLVHGVLRRHKLYCDSSLPDDDTAAAAEDGEREMVQIALMERRRANGVIARAIGERSPCAAARSRHGRCACAPRRAPTPAPCSEPAQRNRRNRRNRRSSIL